MRQDTVARSFFSKNERYADVINGISFQGRHQKFRKTSNQSTRSVKPEGKAEEKMKLFMLIAAMTEDDKVMEIPRLSREPDYYVAMLAMYGL